MTLEECYLAAGGDYGDVLQADEQGDLRECQCVS